MTHTVGKGENEDASGDESIDSQENEAALQEQIDLCVQDLKSRHLKEEEIRQQELKKTEEMQMQKPVEKFDKTKHAGTIYDEKSGRRVPVIDEDQLPKPKNNAEIIMEL